MDKVLIVDYGETSVYNIPLILHDIDCYIIKPTDNINILGYDGIILSGGPDHVYDPSSRKIPSWFYGISCPVLGICYGMQLLVDYMGGIVEPMINHFKGSTEIIITQDDPILTNMPTTVWMNHKDHVTSLPEGFITTSVSREGIISSITDGRLLWGVQFHPESMECLNRELFDNFVNLS